MSFRFSAIGRELRARGHDVTVLAAEPFHGAAERAGLSFVSGASLEDYETITKHPDLWHPRRGMRLVLRLISVALRDDYAKISEFTKPAERYWWVTRWRS